MKTCSSILIPLLLLLSSCANGPEDLPYPIPRHMHDSIRVLPLMPISLAEQRFHTTPKREIIFSASDTSDERWLIFDLEQPGLKPDYEMMIVIQEDSVRHISAWGTGWVTWIFSNEKTLEDKIAHRTDYFAASGVEVSVIDSANNSVE